jgi:hypothetical protein
LHYNVHAESQHQNAKLKWNIAAEEIHSTVNAVLQMGKKHVKGHAHPFVCL